MQYAPWIALIITIAGWLVIHRMALRRQSRQELRDYISKLSDLIYELQNMAISYWLSDGRDLDREAQMVHLSLRIMSLSYILADNEKHFDAVKLMAMELKIAVTGGTFEQNDRERSLEQIKLIRDNASDIANCLERVFFGKYR